MARMEEALRLQVAVVSAVCSKKYFRLPDLVQQLAKLSPTGSSCTGRPHSPAQGCYLAGKVACGIPARLVEDDVHEFMPWAVL